MRSEPPAWKQTLAAGYKRAPFGPMEWAGLAALLSFSISFWLWRDLGRLSEVIAVVLMLISARQICRQDRNEWLWLLLAGWVMFMIVVNLGAIHKYPQFDGDHLRYSRYYARLFLFLVAGWWLGGNLRTAFVFLGLAVAGLYIDVLLNTSPGEWQRMLAGRRVDLSFRNAQHTAILFSVILIGALCFWKRFFYLSSRWLQAAGITTWLALAASSLAIILAAQTRQVFVALPFCLAAAVAWVLFEIRTGRLPRSKLFVFSAAVGLVLVLVFTLFNPLHGIQKRFKSQQETVFQVLHGDFADLPVRGAGIRIRQWRFAARKILQAPLTGHGGATKYLLIKESDMPDFIRSNFGHFHNGYLEMGVAFGIAGLLMLPLLLSVLAFRLLRAWRHNRIPTDFMLFGLLSLIFFAVVNLFESYVMHRTGYFFMCIVGGAIYSLSRPRNFEKQEVAHDGIPAA